MTFNQRTQLQEGADYVKIRENNIPGIRNRQKAKRPQNVNDFGGYTKNRKKEVWMNCNRF